MKWARPSWTGGVPEALLPSVAELEVVEEEEEEEEEEVGEGGVPAGVQL